MFAQVQSSAKEAERTTIEIERKPLRIIQGPKTLLGGSQNTDNVAIDNVHDEVYTTQEQSDSILVFARRASGDMAPLYRMKGDSGVFDINPADKEIIMNNRGSVRIYSMPEAF